MTLTENQINQFASNAHANLRVFPQLASGNASPRHLEYIANKIQEAIDRPPGGKDRLLMCSLPPRHGKTELISIHTTPWFLGRYPSERVIMASYSAELATNNSARAKDIFEEWGPPLFNAHPCKRVFNKTTWNTSEGGGVLAAGVEGPATGFGAKLFIIDDYVKGHQEAESVTHRESVWAWWQSVASTRLHPGATVIILATRWHEDDLIGRLQAQAKDEGDEFSFDMEYMEFPALAEENDILGRKSGEALWPERESRERLLNKKKTVGSYWWNALFQCRPVSRGGTLFRREGFRYWNMDARGKHIMCHRPGEEPLQVNPRLLRRKLIVDPALEIKKVNDPTGMTAWGYCPVNKIWILLDAHTERIEHTKILQRIKQFAFRNECASVLIENEKIGKIIVKQSAGNDDGIPFTEVAIKSIDKYARATPMATYIQNGRVYFKQGASWLADYEDQLTKFPNASHDEYVDTTAYASELESAGSVTEALAGRR